MPRGRTAGVTNTVYLPFNVTCTDGTDGNMRSDGRMSYTWDDESQVISLTRLVFERLNSFITT